MVGKFKWGREDSPFRKEFQVDWMLTSQRLKHKPYLLYIAYKKLNWTRDKSEKKKLAIKNTLKTMQNKCSFAQS